MLALAILVLVLALVVLFRKKRTEKKRYDYACFLLTLKSETDRRERFLKSHREDVPIEIIYGPDTRSVKTARAYEDLIDPEYFEKAVEMHYNPSVHRPDITYFNMGAIGCFMGHMAFYKRCFARGLTYAVMFEDNVVVHSDDLYDQIQSVIDEKGDAFEMCFFHSLARLSDDEGEELEKVRWISSTKCYLVHVENMRKYMKYFLPMDNHVDMKHEDLIAKGARVYYKDLRASLLIDRSHSSTIGHSAHGNPEFFSRQYPEATTKDLKQGF